MWRGQFSISTTYLEVVGVEDLDGAVNVTPLGNHGLMSANERKDHEEQSKKSGHCCSSSFNNGVP